MQAPCPWGPQGDGPPRRKTHRAGREDPGDRGLASAFGDPPSALGPPSAHHHQPPPPPNPIMRVYITVTYNSAIYIQLLASLCAHKILTLEGRLLQKCL